MDAVGGLFYVVMCMNHPTFLRMVLTKSHPLLLFCRSLTSVHVAGLLACAVGSRLPLPWEGPPPRRRPAAPLHARKKQHCSFAETSGMTHEHQSFSISYQGTMMAL